MMLMTTAVMMLMNNDDDDNEDTCQGLRHICLQRESKLCSPSPGLLCQAVNDHIGDHGDYIGDHDDHIGDHDDHQDHDY